MRWHAVLDVHDVPHRVVTSSDPGRIIYSDRWQVGVVPYERSTPTPLDPSVPFTETSAGSKRAFARSRHSTPTRRNRRLRHGARAVGLGVKHRAG